MSYESVIADAIGYDRLHGAVKAGNATTGTPSQATGPNGDSNGALSFDGVNDGAILQPTDKAVNFETPSGFTCTGLHYSASDGGFWVSDFDAEAVKLIDPDDFSVLDTISVGGGALLQGVVTSGDDLWVADVDAQSIRKFSISTGSEDTGAEITLGWSPAGITLNGSGNLLVIRATTLTSANLYEYETDGTSVGSVTVNVGTDYFSLDGCHWVDSSTIYICADRSTSTSSGRPDEVLVVNPSTGSITSRYAAPAAIEGVTVKGSDVFVSFDDEYHSSETGGNRIARLPLSTERDFSLAFYLKTSGVDATEALFSFGDPLGEAASGAHVERGCSVYLLADDTTVRLICDDGSGGQKVADVASGGVTSWKHFAFVFDASAATVTPYVDGSAGTPVSTTGLKTPYMRWRHRVSVAYQHRATTLKRWASVQLGEVVWSETAWSSSEVNQLVDGIEPTYTSGASLDEDGNYSVGTWDNQGNGSLSYVVSVVNAAGSVIGSDTTSTGTIDISEEAGNTVYLVVRASNNGGYGEGDYATRTSGFGSADDGYYEVASVVAGGGVSGDIAQTLPSLAQAAAASVAKQAAAAQALPALTQSASATAGGTTAAIAQTLPTITQSSAAVVTRTAAAAQGLPALSQSASAAVTRQAVIVQALPALAQSAQASSGETGAEAAQALPALMQSAAAAVTRRGTIGQTLPALQQAITAAITRRGAIAQTLPSLTQRAVVDEAVVTINAGILVRREVPIPVRRVVAPTPLIHVEV